MRDCSLTLYIDNLCDTTVGFTLCSMWYNYGCYTILYMIQLWLLHHPLYDTTMAVTLSSIWYNYDCYTILYMIQLWLLHHPLYDTTIAVTLSSMLYNYGFYTILYVIQLWLLHHPLYDTTMTVTLSSMWYKYGFYTILYLTSLPVSWLLHCLLCDKMFICKNYSSYTILYVIQLWLLYYSLCDTTMTFTQYTMWYNTSMKYHDPFYSDKPLVPFTLMYHWSL